MSKPIVYCDYNAGCPVRPEAAAALARVLEAGGNPSSVHAAGRRARAAVEDARDKLAAATGARAENVIFTSGATEAIHLALACSAVACIIVAATEHDAVFEHAARVKARVAPVRADGLIDLDALALQLADAPKPALLAVQLANSETGVIQPIGKVAALARQHGALLLVDAAQALGRIAVDIADLDAAYLVVSSYKIGGPPGAGALILAPGAPFVSTRFGGGQERGRRPGTENPAAIAGFGVAADIARVSLQREAERVATLRDRFERGLPRAAIVFGADAPRLPNTSYFALPGVNAETAVIAIDLDGVAVSSGAACSSGKVRASRVLKAMGVNAEIARGALRVSFGWASADTDVEAALAAIAKLASRRVLEGAA